jgi:hypothetical protein
MGIDALRFDTPQAVLRNYTITTQQPDVSIFATSPIAQAENPLAQLVELKSPPQRLQFQKAQTIEEARAYATEQLGIKNFELGDNLTLANTVNEGLTNIYNRYKGASPMPDNIALSTSGSALASYNSGTRTMFLNERNLANERTELTKLIGELDQSPETDQLNLRNWYKKALKNDFTVFDFIDTDFQRSTIEKLKAFKANPDAFDGFEAYEINCMLNDLTLTGTRYAATGEIDYSRGYASGSKFGLIYHEYAHLLHYRNMINNQYRNYQQRFTEADRATAMKVSEYAATSFDEFVAETYKALYNGATLPRDVMALYQKFNGPKLP